MDVEAGLRGQVGPDADRTRTATDPGCVHHIAFNVSMASFRQAAERLEARGIGHSGVKDRGFMDSIYFRDPLGQRIELACYKFEPPAGVSHSRVLLEAHRIRLEESAYNIQEAHLAEAVERLSRRGRETLSDDTAAKHAYPMPVEEP